LPTGRVATLLRSVRLQPDLRTRCTWCPASAGSCNSRTLVIRQRLDARPRLEFVHGFHFDEIDYRNAAVAVIGDEDRLAVGGERHPHRILADGRRPLRGVKIVGVEDV